MKTDVLSKILHYAFNHMYMHIESKAASIRACYAKHRKEKNVFCKVICMAIICVFYHLPLFCAVQGLTLKLS